MVGDTDADELDLTDDELLDVLKRHTTDRRGAMRLLGAGVGLAALSGTATARDGSRRGQGRGTGTRGGGHRWWGRRPHLDGHFGQPYAPGETVPSGLVDHVVEVHIHEHALTDGDPTTMPFHFSPTGLQIGQGDIIQFVGTTPDHTITAFHEGFGRQQRVPDGMAPFSSPVLPAGASWLYQFEEPGTYDLLCAPHEPFGMVMRLVVGDPSDSDYDDTFGPAGMPPAPRPPASRGELTALGVTSWPFPTAAEVLATNALTVSNIESNGPISVSDVEGDL